MAHTFASSPPFATQGFPVQNRFHDSAQTAKDYYRNHYSNGNNYKNHCRSVNFGYNKVTNAMIISIRIIVAAVIITTRRF